jgi:hypothetical protein
MNMIIEITGIPLHDRNRVASPVVVSRRPGVKNLYLMRNPGFHDDGNPREMIINTSVHININ